MRSVNQWIATGYALAITRVMVSPSIFTLHPSIFTLHSVHPSIFTLLHPSSSQE